MKSFHLPLVIALASLGLAACDYRDETTATVTASPQASLPDDTVLNAPATTGIASGPVTQPTDPVDATPAPVQPMTSAEAPAPLPPAATAEAPAGTPPVAAAEPGTPAPAPDTSAMGAQPGTSAPLGAPAAAAGAAMPSAVASDGVAAPTELARFLEESASTAAARTADQPADKAATKAPDNKAGKAKAS